ncbi:PIN domain-containing protein [Nostoc sp. 106C]|uniref:PIN domain-containing protein n=1 Tax=Nostoc sp. 106C TaxID=1932667 RepID=UPI000A378442|nr:PIN domain-containing protein [Nostoc sp. 106C]OUL30360.1 PIN domain-containing protein [Nostoc sp. 106C]
MRNFYNYRIYLDACCLNRPFDDQTQSRIALETQAILTILSQCQSGIWRLIASAALDAELDQTPDLERLKNVKKILAIAKIKVISSQLIEKRSAELQSLGFSSYDATHIASAERSQADIFLTTDDRLLRKAEKNSQLINVKINNPVQWLVEVIQIEGNNNG